MGFVLVAFSSESLGQNGALSRSGRTCGCETEAVAETRGIVGAGFVQHAIAELSRGFKVLRVVHGDECLERGVGPFAAGAALLARRGVKGGHRRRRRSALPEKIETATIERIPVVL